MKKINEYKVEGYKLKIEDTVIEFEYPIKQSFFVEDILIILLEPPLGIVYNQNVFGVRLNQKKII